MLGFLSMMWGWFGIVLAALTYFAGAPEPFLAWLILTALAGPPLAVFAIVEYRRG